MSFNRELYKMHFYMDSDLFTPGIKWYEKTFSNPFKKGIVDFARNMLEPLSLVNNIMQMNMESAGINTVRFLINSTIGVFGLMDVATAMGIEDRPSILTDTLGYYGVGDGFYLFVPVVRGPSSLRDFGGFIGDIYLNPISYVISPLFGIATMLVSGFYSYIQNKKTIDVMLASSADGYTAVKNFTTIYRAQYIIEIRGNNTTGYYIIKYPFGYGYVKD